MPPFFTLRQVVSQTRARPADVLNVKRALNRMGFYDVPAYGMTPHADRTMFDGIRRFQRANGLRVDGVMQRGHATERAMNDALRLAHERRSKTPKPECDRTRIESEIKRLELQIDDLETRKLIAKGNFDQEAEKQIEAQIKRLEGQLRTWEHDLRRCDDLPTDFWRYQLPKMFGF